MKKVLILVVAVITLLAACMSMSSCSMLNFGSSSHECSTENIPLLDLKEARKNLLEFGYDVDVYGREDYCGYGQDGAISASNNKYFIQLIEFDTEELAKLYCATKMHIDAGIPGAKAELDYLKYVLKHYSDSMSLSDVKNYEDEVEEIENMLKSRIVGHSGKFVWATNSVTVIEDTKG